jgi:hypothetical protein
LTKAAIKATETYIETVKQILKHNLDLQTGLQLEVTALETGAIPLIPIPRKDWDEYVLEYRSVTSCFP